MAVDVTARAVKAIGNVRIRTAVTRTLPGEIGAIDVMKTGLKERAAAVVETVAEVAVVETVTEAAETDEAVVVASVAAIEAATVAEEVEDSVEVAEAVVSAAEAVEADGKYYFYEHFIFVPFRSQIKLFNSNICFYEVGHIKISLLKLTVNYYYVY